MAPNLTKEISQAGTTWGTQRDCYTLGDKPKEESNGAGLTGSNAEK